jgi:hypothetical protein
MAVMHASNKPAPPAGPVGPLHGAEHAAAVQAMWAGALGRTVRCVPARRTVMAASAGRVLYGKLHGRGRAAAAAEWRWLHVLPLLGIGSAKPVAWIGAGRRSLLVTEALRGRSLDAWAADAVREGWMPQLVHYVTTALASFVRRLHDHGLIHRDLNGAHLWVVDPRRSGAPVVLDVERVFRPRWRVRRWIVKDLASLYASMPTALPPSTGLRFLRRYLGGAVTGQRGLLRAIERKVQRIRAHRPRYG